MNNYEATRGMFSAELPFAHELIPVVEGLVGLKDLANKYPGFTLCPYLADKTGVEWSISTSRRYMNQVLPNFIYIPVNIMDGDENGVADVVWYAAENPKVAAVNITKPHKSAKVLRKLFFDDENSTNNVDTLIKSKLDNKLYPYDLNAPAFVNWFEQEVGEFADKNVVIIGVGGVGEPVAKHIDKKYPKSILLVDVKDRSDMLDALVTQSRFYDHLSEIEHKYGDMVVINASGKDGISDDTGLAQFLKSHTPGIFVDLRPHLQIDIVERAKAYGWSAYTGNGMNARNDYELLSGIMEYSDIPEERRPSFAEFEKIVARAS